MTEFRKDIQCLRGISILFVYIYHFNKYILPTGFIGVDIFFYISGYVNTLAYKSKIQNVIRLFYINRIKRLFPVSHLALYTSLIICNRMNILYQSKHYCDVIFSLMSISNYRFIYLSVDYLSQSEPPSIVLHYWSLAVEDQFYLLYPIFISYLYKKYEYIIFAILLSFFYGWYININHHNISYFSLLSRSYQFFLGIITTKDRMAKMIYKINSDILLGLIIVFCSIFRNDNLFPTPLSVIPLIFVYYIVTVRNNSIILKSKFLLELGNISFSFYLFHYLLLYKLKNGKSIFSFFLIFIITLLFSLVVNRFYENPLRRINNVSIVIISFITSTLIILFLCIFLIKRTTNYMNNIYKAVNDNNYLNYSPNSSIDEYYHIKSNGIIYSPDIMKKVWRDFQKNQCFCILKSKHFVLIANKYPLVLLLTDSHGEQWFNTIIPYAKETKYIIIHVWFWEITILNKDFNNIHKIFSLISKVNYVISSHYLSYKSNFTIFKENYFSYLNILLKHSDRIYVIHDTPHFKDDPNMCLLSTSNYDNCYSLIGINASHYLFPIYQNKKIHYINMLKYICLKSFKCYYLWNSIPIYLDNNHLSFQFTKTLSVKLLKYLHFKRQTSYTDLGCNKSFKCSYSTDL